MKPDQIEILFCSDAGTKHKKEHKLCQDYVDRIIEKDIAAVALADGAGSKKFARKAAEYAVNFTLDYFRNAPTPNTDTLRDDLYNYLNERFMQEEAYRSEYAATLLFAAVTERNVIIGHMGDGAILERTDSEFVMCSPSENGKYSNETFFFPGDGIEHFRVSIRPRVENSCYILVSDGVSGALFDEEENSAVQANYIIETICREEPDYFETMMHDVFGGVLSEYNSDDKSIAVVIL